MTERQLMQITFDVLGDDRENDAITIVSKALENLDQEAALRVLSVVMSRVQSSGDGIQLGYNFHNPEEVHRQGA